MYLWYKMCAINFKKKDWYQSLTLFTSSTPIPSWTNAKTGSLFTNTCVTTRWTGCKMNESIGRQDIMNLLKNQIQSGYLLAHKHLHERKSFARQCDLQRYTTITIVFILKHWSTYFCYNLHPNIHHNNQYRYHLL